MGINFKYEGMLLGSLNKFYAVMKFDLPMVKDLKFSPIKFDSNCNYLIVNINRSKFLTQYIPYIMNFVKK